MSIPRVGNVNLHYISRELHQYYGAPLHDNLRLFVLSPVSPYGNVTKHHYSSAIRVS